MDPPMDMEHKVDRREKQEKSYLSVAMESITSRTSTPKPTFAGLSGEGSGLKNQHGGYQSNHQRFGLSSRRYPTDCPSLEARWFYAVDVPKRKPKLLKNSSEDTKSLATPKKFVTFSPHDSRAIEDAYQKLADEYDGRNREIEKKAGDEDTSAFNRKTSTSINEAGYDEYTGGQVRVPVHEDFLFDVDVTNRELAPVYWLGNIYEVRRGSWFFYEGGALRPCDENLASQLEEGYLKIKPFRYPKAPEKPASSNSNNDSTKSLAISGAFSRSRSGSGEVTPTELMGNDATGGTKDAPTTHQPQTYRLFGTYMNSIVTYQDSTVAWILQDSIMSRVSSTVYQKFAGGGYLGGLKVVRGFTELGKSKDTSSSDKMPTTPTSAALKLLNSPPSLHLDERQQKLLKRRSAPSTLSEKSEIDETLRPSALSNNIDSDQEAESREREERVIQNDFNDCDEEQGREIDHLILVTHGIGQRLGMRTESVNFVHDVNVLRQTIKSVYSSSSDLQALNSQNSRHSRVNSRVQVLPILWRHLLDFPQKGVRQNRKEHDLGEAFGEDEEYPSLDDITVEGVPFVRSLITDLALDILLYQSAYREHITSIVLDESNRIYKLFCERNPNFRGKVSLCGHSLGSAILFDILCRQKEDVKIHGSSGHQQRPVTNKKPLGKDFSFHFDVEDFYCLGSPIGLFQMLKGRMIASRHDGSALPAESPMDPDKQDPFLGGSISAPKCSQLYNIFHPTDPISYRLEPLISPAMSSLKPQLLPYTKKTLSASVSGIGARVSGLWSSLSAGIASSLLNRSLGLTNEDVARMEVPASQAPLRTGSQSIAAETNMSAGGVPSIVPALTNEKKRQLAEETVAADRDGKGKSPPTLIDDEIETLYAGFQRRRKSHQHDQAIDNNWAEAEERGRKLKREEQKVRALNRNGRVDYSIQESVLDFNPINTIASHLSYWADEDVSHFMMSQLLSRNRNLTDPTKTNIQK